MIYALGSSYWFHLGPLVDQRRSRPLGRPPWRWGVCGSYGRRVLELLSGGSGRSDCNKPRPRDPNFAKTTIMMFHLHIATSHPKIQSSSRITRGTLMTSRSTDLPTTGPWSWPKRCLSSPTPTRPRIGRRPCGRNIYSKRYPKRVVNGIPNVWDVFWFNIETVLNLYSKRLV